MKKLALYILACSFLFAYLDWKVVHLTRWAHPEWKEWMHAHEKNYAAITWTAEAILCTPCFSLKPVFYEAIMRVEASQAEQDSLTHAPRPSSQGFYRLPERGKKYVFVPWLAWFLYWTPISVIWWKVLNGIYERRDRVFAWLCDQHTVIGTRGRPGSRPATRLIGH